MKPWAKMASDLDSNPKIIKAGYDGKNVYLWLLRRNALGDHGGVIPAEYGDPEYIASQLGCTVQQAATGCNACNVAGLISVAERCITILGWEEWSVGGGDRPRTSTERSRQRRAILRDATMQRDATLHPLHATRATDATTDQSRSDQIRSDQREEREIARDPSVTAPTAPPVPPVRSPEDREVWGIVAMVVSRLNSARKELDPTAMSIATGSGASLPERELSKRIRETASVDRRRNAEHVVNVVIAEAKREGKIDNLRVGWISSESAWARALASSGKPSRSSTSQSKSSKSLTGMSAFMASTKGGL